MCTFMRTAVVVTFLAFAFSTSVCFAQESDKNVDKDLAADLKLLQGTWEMVPANDAAATVRSVKIVEGNKETVRRFNAKTGELIREHTVEIKLSKSGGVRVVTFFPVGGSPKQGLSFVYKIDKDNFYDCPGLLQNDEFRDYGDAVPHVWHWKRIRNADGEKSK